MAEEIFGNGPAVIFFVDEILGRDSHIVKEHFVHFMAAIHKHERADADTRRLHINE